MYPPTRSAAGVEVRHDHCAKAETRTASAGRAVASRRSVCLHQRPAVVHLACRRQQRRSSGHPGSTKANPQAARKFDAKTPEEAGHHSSYHRHRQAWLLQLCAARTWDCAAARQRSLEEYRAENSHQPLRQRERRMKRLEVTRIGTALSLNPRRRLQCIQYPTTGWSFSLQNFRLT